MRPIIGLLKGRAFVRCDVKTGIRFRHGFVLFISSTLLPRVTHAEPHLDSRTHRRSKIAQKTCVLSSLCFQHPRFRRSSGVRSPRNASEPRRQSRTRPGVGLAAPNVHSGVPHTPALPLLTLPQPVPAPTYYTTSVPPPVPPTAYGRMLAAMGVDRIPSFALLIHSVRCGRPMDNRQCD